MVRVLCAVIVVLGSLQAQTGKDSSQLFWRRDFIDQFDGTTVTFDPRGINGWTYSTGDGNATMTFRASGKGYATLEVDATKDKRGIWWALIKRCVSKDFDLHLIQQPTYEFQIEARLRVSDAPKRVNLHLNTQRTKDFHTHLMEFDIPDTLQWYTISMTTKGFDAQPGDTVYGQLALMDWGFDRYRVDIDYFRVRIVHSDSAENDKGEQVPYHPPVPPPESFSIHLPVTDDGTIDTLYDDLNFSHWISASDSLSPAVLAVGGSKMILLRWDLRQYRGKEVTGSGLLELRTNSLFRLTDTTRDFGMLRVSEIIGGDPFWDGERVTYRTWTGGRRLKEVVNSQMIIDVEATKEKNSPTYITISKPVLQRLIEGKTIGIAIKELGSLAATFYSKRSFDGMMAPVLHFSLNNGGKKK